MNPNFVFQRHALVIALGAVFAPVLHAQQTPAPERAAAASAPPKVTTLKEVVVTGNPLRSTDLAAPVSVLSGDELVLRRAGTLGETLNGLPGVSSSYFGPNANRPVVRGLDGDRVRVLSNAGASLDASSLSFDHAVPIDPLVVERIEVLRGPGALLYGGSAVGGVVNALDNRIPKEALNGVSGAAEVRFGGAERERGGAALVEAGNGQFAIHADVFGRETSDLKVPRYTPVEGGVALDPTERVRNSAARTRGGALGGSLTFDRGYLGLSADTYDSRYGVVAEPDVLIRMKRDHVGVAGELRDTGGLIRTLRVQLNDTRYKHEEIEGSGEIGTTFKSSGTEARVELEHAPIGPLRGLVGVQAEDFDFSALGEEAFVPSTRTRRQALFVTEEMAWPLGTLSAGLRVERARVSSEGDADPGVPKFGAAAQRSFSLRSASLSNVYKLGPTWNLTGTLSASERAPTSFELFAGGLHAATGAFERGDPSLQTERGNNVDLAVEWKSGTDRLRMGVFSARFSRFIALQATGTDIPVTDEDGNVSNYPEYAFRSVPARLRGFEIDGRRRLIDSAWTLDLSGKLDLTRATDSSTGEPLPRVAPMRLALGLDAGFGAWAARIELDHAARQNRVPANDTATASYNIVNLSLTHKFELGGSHLLWFMKLDNVGNTLAYNASTIDTVRGLAPLPGRALKAGLRVSF
ncbi:MAG: TonB-dependent receptor [Burkholderiales bacterium]|nr:TonB-dependent receptor [Burkholderiales bacterium]